MSAHPRKLKTAFVTVTGDSNEELVAAVAGKRIVVAAVTFVGPEPVGFEFRTGTTTPISPVFLGFGNLTVIIPAILDGDNGWFETEKGAALNCNITSVATAASVLIKYFEAPYRRGE